MSPWIWTTKCAKNSVADDCKCRSTARSLKAILHAHSTENIPTHSSSHSSARGALSFHISRPLPHPRLSNVPLASPALIPLTPKALTCDPFLNLCKPTATFQLSSSAITNIYLFPSASLMLALRTCKRALFNSPVCAEIPCFVSTLIHRRRARASRRSVCCVTHNRRAFIIGGTLQKTSQIRQTRMQK